MNRRTDEQGGKNIEVKSSVHLSSQQSKLPEKRGKDALKPFGIHHPLFGIRKSKGSFGKRSRFCT
ncbi:hypothetical protein [Flavisolibacter nicotianae]|uniref:hypothetical protein n=1 Tax=Flavisolibacter nicotianae TaxID=2364882 RepID=UPI0013C50655|nr:hypothetical protein [Flavisolibacter nicotianae]